jgi:2-iminobutanoate/2-iminopropanoate deaminase
MPNTIEGLIMSRKIINSSDAPQPIGPYSQAILYKDLLFVSGQIAIDPKSGELIKGDIIKQTHRAIKNIVSVLEAAGTGLDAVLKTTIYLKNLNDFNQVNEIYSEYFVNSLPARSTVEVNRLPKDVLVEIDCIAYTE